MRPVAQSALPAASVTVRGWIGYGLRQHHLTVSTEVSVLRSGVPWLLDKHAVEADELSA
jgi:hypothetical protein